MAYKLQSDGTWVHTNDSKSDSKGGKTSSSGKSGKSSKSGKSIENKGVHDDKSAISEISANKEEKLKYTETASMKLLGTRVARKGNWVDILNGVVDRWLGRWLILATTHIIDSKGYTVDAQCGRKPVESDSKSNKNKNKSNSKNKSKSKAKSSSTTTKSMTPASSKTTTKSKGKGSSSSSDKVWKLQSDGTWVKKSK